MKLNLYKRQPSYNYLIRDYEIKNKILFSFILNKKIIPITFSNIGGDK